MITLSAPVRHEGGWMSTRPERPLHGPLQRFDLETQVACDAGLRVRRGGRRGARATILSSLGVH
jgi:hypothetical protein